MPRYKIMSIFLATALFVSFSIQNMLNLQVYEENDTLFSESFAKCMENGQRYAKQYYIRGKRKKQRLFKNHSVRFETGELFKNA